MKRGEDEAGRLKVVSVGGSGPTSSNDGGSEWDFGIFPLVSLRVRTISLTLVNDDDNNNDDDVRTFKTPYSIHPAQLANRSTSTTNTTLNSAAGALVYTGAPAAPCLDSLHTSLSFSLLAPPSTTSAAYAHTPTPTPSQQLPLPNQCHRPLPILAVTPLAFDPRKKADRRAPMHS